MEHEGMSESTSSSNNIEVSTPRKKIRNQARKRKRSENSDDEDEIIPENALLMEEKLHLCAKKNNLDDTSMKKILKKVVTNDHVLALVKLKEEEANEIDENVQPPKLTRSKVKELKKVDPNTAWNLEKLELTPIQHIPVKTRPEVTALIAQELAEDEDDDEYEPTHDEVMSDDENTIDTCSDVDSQPRTPATPMSLPASSPKVVNDGPFKVPQEVSTSSRRKLNMEEEATIALRTRSKLSLSSTSIEHIESSFVPPDEVPLADVDDLWNQFLEECLNPQQHLSVSRTEDDDEADPEYNVTADPDDNEDEELERNTLRISKKELNDLVTELFNIMPETVADEILSGGTGGKPQALQLSAKPPPDAMVSIPHWEGKQEPLSDEETATQQAEKIHAQRFSIGKSEPGDINDTVNSNEDSGVKETNNIAVDRKIRGNAEDKSGDINKGKNHRKTNDNQRVNCKSTTAPQTFYAIDTDPPIPLVLKMMDKNSETVLEIHVPQENGQPINVVLPEQIELIQQQLRMHVQLAASNFLQLCVHPVHWQYAATFKNFLISLNNLVDNYPTSVASVCNLKPALDLVLSWENAVTSETPENIAMVEWIQKQCDKSARWRRDEAIKFSTFHKTFMETVSNSSVFLYPHLLPPMPYRPDQARRTFYTRAEDDLLIHGLDMFWKFMEANPEIYPPPNRRLAHNHRWGLYRCVELVCKHMMPAFTPVMAQNHISHSRRIKGHPLCEFFKTRKVKPVKHRLLPFNPNMTLYEQPEYELPRIWVKYLAKSNGRFRSYLRENPAKRLRLNQIKTDESVEFDVGKAAVAPTKKPLPGKFYRTIKNIDKICHDDRDEDSASDVVEDAPEIIIRHQQDDADGLQDNSQTNTETKTPQIIIDCQITGSQNTDQNSNEKVANTFTVVNTRKGAILRHVGSDLTEDNNAELFVNEPLHKGVVTIKVNTYWSKLRALEADNSHCCCCDLIRQICKQRQKLMTEYFTDNLKRKCCPCKKARRVKYPRVTNKLRRLVKYFRNDEMNIVSKLKYELEKVKESATSYYCSNDKGLEHDLRRLQEEVAIAEFQTKFITTMMTGSRNGQARSTVCKLISKFYPETDDPVWLMQQIKRALGNNLVDVYKELCGFLNPVQAIKLGSFRDYFISHCLEELIKKIKQEVKDPEHLTKLLTHVEKVLTEKRLRPCGLCYLLLKGFKGVPKLAEHVFSLFPHKRSKEACEENYESTDTDENTEETVAQTNVCDLKSVSKDNVEQEKNDNLRCEALIERDETSSAESFDMPLETYRKKRYNLRDSNQSKTVTKSKVSENKKEEIYKSNVKVETAIDIDTDDSIIKESEHSNSKVVEMTLVNTDIETEESTFEQNIDNSNKKTLNESHLGKQNNILDSTVTCVSSQHLVNEHSECTTTTTSDTEVMMDAVDNNTGAVKHKLKLEPSESPSECDDNTEIDTLELTVSRTEVQQKVNNNSNLIISITQEEIKTEPQEWTREEDKMILQALKYCSTPAQRKNINILDVLEVKGVIRLLSENMTHRSIQDIRDRVLVLLELLVLSEK